MANSEEDKKVLAAIRSGNAEKLRAALDAGGSPNTRGRTGSALSEAAEKRSLDMMSLLIERGAHMGVRTQGGSILENISEMLWTEGVRFLLEKGAKTRGYDGKLALHNACEKGGEEIVMLLRERDVHPDKAAGFKAAKAGATQVLRMLLADGSLDADRVDESGRTMAEIAGESGHLETARELWSFMSQEERAAAKDRSIKTGNPLLSVAEEAELREEGISCSKKEKRRL